MVRYKTFQKKITENYYQKPAGKCILERDLHKQLK